MLPQMIQEYVEKVTDRKAHPETRQFYYSTLREIQKAIDKAIADYEKETTKK